MTNEARRPDYSRGSLFNQEAHLNALPARRRAGAPRRSERRKAPKARSPVRPAANRRWRAPSADQAASAPFDDAPPAQSRRTTSSPVRSRRGHAAEAAQSAPDLPGALGGLSDEAEWAWEPAEHIKHTEAFAVWCRRGRGVLSR